jgi:hypothetical protein
MRWSKKLILDHCLIFSLMENVTGLYNEVYGATIAAWDRTGNMPKT